MGSHNGVDVQSLEDPRPQLLIQVLLVHDDVEDEPRLVLISPRDGSGLKFREEPGGDPLHHSSWREWEGHLKWRTLANSHTCQSKHACQLNAGSSATAGAGWF